MTDINELDRARAEEARRQVLAEDPTHHPRVGAVAIRAAMLARTGWEPVDEDLIAAREIAATSLDSRFPDEAANIRHAVHDSHSAVQAALAAIKRGRQLEREALERGFDVTERGV